MPPVARRALAIRSFSPSTCSRPCSTRRGALRRLCSKRRAPTCRPCARPLARKVEGLPRVSGGAEPGLSRRALEVIRRADDEAKKLKDDYVSVEHYVLAMAQHDREVGGAVRAVRRLGYEKLLSALASVRGSQRITDADPEGQVPGSREVLPRPDRGRAARARRIRSSVATRRSGASCRSSRGGRRTTRCSSASPASARRRSSRGSRSESSAATCPSR